MATPSASRYAPRHRPTRRCGTRGSEVVAKLRIRKLGKAAELVNDDLVSEMTQLKRH